MIYYITQLCNLDYEGLENICEGGSGMKFKDYLIMPVIAMYVLYTSCAYIAKPVEKTETAAAPAAVVDPSNICWGTDSGEQWFAEGNASSRCFYVSPDKNENNIFFVKNTYNSENYESKYVISDMHMKCAGNDGTNYDLIFPDEMTAYDCNSGTYYKRGDYNNILEQLMSGKFVNSENKNDFYVFKPSGKSAEYFGNKIFKGKWQLETSDTVTVYDNACKDYFRFNLITDYHGSITGFRFNDTVYTRSA